MTVVGRVMWWVVGAALVVVGVALAVVAGSEPMMQFSVLTYEPATDDQFSIAYSGGAFVSPRQVVGVVLAGLGVLVVVARAAYLLGRRSRPS